MRASRWVMAMTLGLAGLAIVTDPAAVPAADETDARLERLVDRLGCHLFRDREAAARELDALGEKALTALRHGATHSRDPETRRRAAELAERISQRLANARILEPTLVSLNYDRTPLADAVADFAQRTGTPIALFGDAAKFEGRTVTVVSSPVTYWRAIELFCHRAGLHEWDGVSSLPASISGPAPRGEQSPPVGEGVQIVGQTLVRRGRVSAVTATLPPVRVALLDGPGKALPVQHLGAVRVRSLPIGTAFPATVGKDVLLPLHIALEPRLNALDVHDLRVERALDDQGEAVMATVIRAESAMDADDLIRQLNGRMIPQLTLSRGGPVALRLKRGEATSKRLRELAGTMVVQVFVAEPVVSVERPGAAIGRTVHGEGGIALTLLALTRLETGEYQVAAEQTLPFGVVLGSSVGGLVGTQGQFNGPIQRWGPLGPSEADLSPAEGGEYQGLAVEDAQGQRFTVVNGAAEITNLLPRSFTVRTIATFRAPAKGSQPARVVFLARRPATVEVPFVLRDVPLP